MNTAIQDQQTFRAILESISSFTVGIAVENNTAIGTGTLIASGSKRFVLTAEHVIRDVNPAQISFWCKPKAPLIEKPASQVTNAELKTLTSGIAFPTREIKLYPDVDLALMEIDPEFELHGAAQFYDFSRSDVVGSDMATLNGISLLCFGFPVDNSRIVAVDGNHVLRFLGCTSNVCYYESALDADSWQQLPSSLNPEHNFVFRYNEHEPELKPPGFSGSGVWINATAESNIWAPDPLLVGVVHRYASNLSVLIATKLLKIREAIA